MALSRKTGAFEDWRRSERERALEDLYHAYPALIDPALDGARRQVFLDARSRCDLLFDLEGTAWVVEIKRDTAGLPALRQLVRYLDLLKRTHGSVRGTLVAADFLPAVERKLKTTRHPIELKRLQIDVPTEIRICRQCRRARAASITRCPHDGEVRVL